MEQQSNHIPEVEAAEPADEPMNTEVQAAEVSETDWEDERPTADMTPIFLGLAIAIIFVLGLGIGFFGRPLLIKDLPIEVVVTVVPHENATITQVNTSATAAEAGEKQGNSTSITENETDNAAMPTPTIMDFVLSDARHFQGNDTAPVTIVEFSDFNCGFCGRFATETLDQLRQNYVEPGKARFVYKHFAILGPSSTRAAEASECAAEQDKFWDFHDTTFANRVAGLTDLSDDSLVAQAADIGLDVPEFSDCLTSGKYASQISQESLSVQSMGVRGTPGFLINGVFISGAQPFEVFQEVIEEQLASLETE